MGTLSLFLWRWEEIGMLHEEQRKALFVCFRIDQVRLGQFEMKS